MKPKLKRRLRSSVALSLCASMLMSVAVGCKSNNGENDNKVTEAQASYVTWTKSGEFTTSLSAKDVDLSDVEAADVSVVTFKPVAEADEDKNNSSSEQADEPETISYPVENVEKKGGELKITFKDENASEKSVDSYTVEIEKKNISTQAVVDYPVPTVKTEETGILATEENPELTLTLDSGLFAKEVKPEQISLAGSFSDMEVDKVSTKSNKLDLKLKGKVEMPEGQSIYVDGIIGINPSAMENERSSASVRVPIQQSLITFNSDEMTVSGSTVTVPLTVIGEEDLDNIKAESIRFFADDSAADDEEEPQERPAVTVTGVEKTDENKLNVTMNVDGVTDKNSAAEALDNRTVQLDGIQVDDDIYETTEGLPFASMVSYGSKTLDHGGRYFIEAKTYMNIIKWDDKYITKLVPAASRTVRRFTGNEFGYSALQDDLDSVWEHDWLREGKTGIGDYYDASAFFNEQKKRFDGVGDKNLIPIVRWVIDTPGDDGTSPNRDYSMNSDSTGSKTA